MQFVTRGQGPTLDVQVLDGLEKYIATEHFLHKLEQASAEWIDLSEHQRHTPGNYRSQPGLELTQVVSSSQQSSTESAVAGDATAASSTCSDSRTSRDSSRSRSGFFSRWSRSPSATSVSGRIQNTTNTAAPLPAAVPANSNGAVAVDAQGSMAASTFEVVEQQPPLHHDLALQEPFVLVSSDDAIEGMAYYIALYLSRAPEARYMDPKQLQAALKQTFTSIRRSRYRVVWDWGRRLYRWGAISYSALQLYEHPWVVRALLCAIWTSSKMAMGLLV